MLSSGSLAVFPATLLWDLHIPELKMFENITEEFEKQQAAKKQSVVETAQRGVAHAGNPQGGVTKQEEQGGTSTEEQAPAQKELTDSKVTKKVDSESAEDGEIDESQEQLDEDGYGLAQWIARQNKRDRASGVTDDDEAADEEGESRERDDDEIIIPLRILPPAKAGEPKPVPETKKAEETSPSVPEKVGEPSPSAPEGKTEKVEPGTAGNVEEESKTPDPAVAAAPSTKKGRKAGAPRKTKIAGATNALAEKANDPSSAPAQGMDEKTPKAEIVLFRSDAEREIAIQRIRERHAAVLHLGHKTLQMGRDIGEDLARFKKSVGHGNWQQVVETELGMDPKCASRYMRIYHKWELLAKSDKFPDFNLSSADDYIATEEKKAKAEKNAIAKVSSDTAVSREVKSDSVVGPTQVVEPEKPENPTDEVDTGATSDQQPAEEKRTEEILYVLADDVGVTPTSAGWMDGFIPWLQVKQSLDQIAYQGRSSDDKSRFVARQRVVLQVVGNANRDILKDSPPEAVKDYLLALDTARKLIVEVADEDE